jgi:hypothetical protein
MTEFDRFDQNARARGILIDTNLVVLLIVGSVNRDRIALFRRTRQYTPADWDLLTGILEQVPRRYAIRAHSFRSQRSHGSERPGARDREGHTAQMDLVGDRAACFES